MENSNNPALEVQPRVPSDPLPPPTPPAESQNVAFKLGGSEEADLNNDMEAKDLDIANGKNLMSYNAGTETPTENWSDSQV